MQLSQKPGEVTKNIAGILGTQKQPMTIYSHL